MKNKCIDCNKEISRYAKRCRSCSKKGHKQTEEAKEKCRVGNIGKHNHYSGKNNPNYGKHRPCYKETKEKIRISLIGKNKGEKSGRFGKSSWNKNLTKETDERVAKLSRPRSDETKEKIRKFRIEEYKREPERIQQSLKNGFGNKCYYDNKFFPSNAERDCYIELKKLGFKVEHNFKGRFDFLVNDKIVVEFHSYDRNGLTDEQYYRNRRKLLDEYGYKNLKLIVIKDLKEIENNLLKEEK